MAAVVGGSATEPSQDLDAPTERRLSGHLDRLIEGRETLAEVLFLALSAGLAWLVRFTQDDAFITFRFSRNLARGEGLVFNPGEQVEGYTNFLYAVVHALPERLGWNTPLFSQVYGIALFLVTLALAMRTARALFSSRGFGFLVGLTLTANMTFLAYATAGMETMQQTLCLTAVVLVVLPALILLGLATRLAALGMIGFVVLQSLTDVIGHGADATTIGAWFDRLPDSAILDQRALWLMLLLVLVFRGGGPLALDRLISRRLNIY